MNSAKLWIGLMLLVTSQLAKGATLSLNFSAAGGGINDANGVGTGLPDRLPGTGASLPANSTGLNLNSSLGQLLVTSTSSDVNFQINLDNADFIGTRLSSLGYTGTNDFSVTLTVRAIDYGLPVDQFGVFIGASSTQVFRAGGIFGSQFEAFGVSNTDGSDSGYTGDTGIAPLSGDDLVLTLSRSGGVFSVTFLNLTNSARSGTLTILQPSFLNSHSDLTAGFFINNAMNTTTRVMRVDEFGVTVNPSAVPEPGTWFTAAAGSALLAFARRRRKPRGE